MTTLVLDAQTGISGDMTVAALLDLGANFEKLQTVLNSLPDQQFKVEVSRVKKNSLDVCDFNVILTNGAANNDHDMRYLFGESEQVQSSHHGDKYHEEEHHHHHHEHRHLSDVENLIDQTTASEKAKILAKRIFGIVAEAESQAHGVPINEVHFHEVGALDSIVDILSVAVLIDDLKIDQTIVTALGEGFGEIRCQHGLLPIPVPAVSHIAQTYGLTLSHINCRGEFITPTGAAIIAALEPKQCMPEQYKILKSGLGAGKRSYERASLLRATLIEATEKNSEHDLVVELSTNIDDSTAEMLGFTLERLYAAGALEAWFSPVFMKKNRPAYILSVLCRPEQQRLLENVIFEHTTSIGIRSKKLTRRILKREIRDLETPLGVVKVKVCQVPDEAGQLHTRYYPEYESVKALSLQTHRSLSELYRIIQNIAEHD